MNMFYNKCSKHQNIFRLINYLDHSENYIQEYHDKMIYALQQAEKLTIPFTKPLERNRKKGKAGWNEHIKPFRIEALY